MIYEPLEEDEMMLYALLMDESGIDQAEFALVDDSKMEPVLDDEGNQIYDDEGKKKMEKGDGIFRCWPFQYPWFRDTSKRQIDSAARSVGKSMSIKLRALAFPFIHPGEEMVITAPGDNHLTLVTDNVESLYSNCRLAKEMLVKSGKGTGAITHKPFKVNFAGSNGRIVGRIPHQDGKNIKGSLRAGSLILTRDRGYIPIETVVAGDYVWSHEQVWDEVYTCYELSEEDCYFVEGQGSFGVYVNEDHRILTRNDESKQPGKVGVQLSARPSWEYVPHLQSSKYQKINSYWTSASFFGDEILPYDLPDFSRCKTSFDPEDADFWWFAGRYVADGSADVGAIKISAHPKDHSALLACLDRMGASYSISESDTSADNVNVYNAAMTKWVSEHFGHHSHTKKLPTWLLTERDWVKQAFFDGYLSGDGTEVSTGTRKEITAGSASKQLSVGMRDLAASLGYNTSCYKAIVKVTHIMGTKLKKKPQDSWRVTYSKDGRGYNDIKGFTSYKVRKITKVDPCKFYGLSTELGSYYAEGVFHHNTHPLWLEMDEACFPPNTPIRTADGDKRICDIQAGDMVLGRSGFNPVKRVFNHGFGGMINLVLSDEREITCTPDHHFLQIDGSWRIAFDVTHVVDERGHAVDVVGVGIHGVPEEKFDLEVENDPSYCVNGIIVHNSDYPPAGWVEIGETVKRDNPLSRWRAHGVTRGFGDDFDKKISGKEDKTWKVHRLPATIRPEWTEADREYQMNYYEDPIDFDRNVLGRPGDQHSPMFSLSKIMANVDQRENSKYNSEEYFNINITDHLLREHGHISELLDFPPSHKENYQNFWIGCDFGWVQSPSAITVFAEVKKPKSELTSLKLLTRVLLTRIDPTEQRDAIMEFMEFYRPQAFALDATGAGFVIFDFLKEAAAQDESLSYMLKRIKDYNFQQKVVVGFDEDVEINEFDPDGWKEAAIKRDFLEASTDAIRVLLDSKRLPLPLDYEVISEFQGVPKNLKKQKMDEYGRQGKRKSGMHTLDAIRMAVLAHSQNVMDRTIAQHEEIWEAPEMIVF